MISSPFAMPDEPATFIYKTVQGCELRADVYGADAGRPPCPVVLFLHGGALILGSRAPRRETIITRQGPASSPRLYSAVVLRSLDPADRSDLRSPLNWVRSNLDNIID